MLKERPVKDVRGKRALKPRALRKKRPRLVAVVALTRHETVQKQKGRWADENKYPLDLPGIAGAIKHGENIANKLKRRPSVLKELKKHGIFYTGLHSPLKRTVETNKHNLDGFRARLNDLGVKVKGSFLTTNEYLRFPELDKRLRQYPAGKQAIKHTIELLKAHGVGEELAEIESKESVRTRMGRINETVKAIQDAKIRGEKDPVFFLNFVTHGGAGEVPLQIDDAAELLAGKTLKQLGGAFQRGEGIIQLVYSNGRRKTIVFRKKK